MIIESKINGLKDLLSFNTQRNTVITLPNNTGKVDVQKDVISEDILLFRNKFEFFENTFVTSTSSERGLCIDITLDGSISYTDHILNQKIEKNKNTTFLKYLNTSHTSFQANRNTTCKNIGIIIKGDFLNKFLLNKIDLKDKIKKNYSNNIPTLFKSTQTNIRTTLLATEIYNSPFEQELDTIFLQSKVYEIIYNEFSDILQKNGMDLNKDIKLTKEDIHALFKAKTLINEEKYFSSISKLSKKVALNEFKLKYGFKKLFNTSPGAMMLEGRMQESKRLLLESEFSITEISKMVGYRYINSFSNAFSNKFGINPKELMKKRKYYY